MLEPLGMSFHNYAHAAVERCAAGTDSGTFSRGEHPRGPSRPQAGAHARRWIVERFFAWLQLKRRLLVRWEYYPTNFLGFVQLGALSILLKAS
jgi:transposase